jgi:hypothetical protein
VTPNIETATPGYREIQPKDDPAKKASPAQKRKK